MSDQKHPFSHIKFQVELIGPELAAKYLALNVNNRRISKRWVKELAAMMRAGQWSLSHQGIAFDEDGNLLDGQHRLSAVIDAGVAVYMLVIRSVSSDAAIVMDTGKARPPAEAGRRLGVEANPQDYATARRMFYGFSLKKSLTRPDHVDFTSKHLDAIKFSKPPTDQAGLSVSAMRAVVARAYYTVDHDRLVAFLNCIAHGHDGNNVIGPGDIMAIKLQRLMTRNSKWFATEWGRLELFRKTESALRAFIEKRSCSSIYEANQEMFPLPEETEERKRFRGTA